MPQIPQLDGAQTASPADTQASLQASHQTSPLTGSLWQSFAAEWKSFLASRWARQTGRRAIHIAELMRAGKS